MYGGVELVERAMKIFEKIFFDCKDIPYEIRLYARMKYSQHNYYLKITREILS